MQNDILESYQRRLMLRGTSTGKASSAAPDFDTVLRIAVRTQSETIGLLSQQAQACLRTHARLANCRTPGDVALETLRFWQTATEQYAATAQQLVSLWSAPVMAATQRPAEAAEEPRRVRVPALSQVAPAEPVLFAARPTPMITRDYIRVPETAVAGGSPAGENRPLGRRVAA
jgi:hypothetical protein